MRPRKLGAGRTRCRWLTLGCLILLLGAGCGDGKTALRGEVTFDGQPVPEGSISFEAADGKGSVTGGVITAGKYDVPAAVGMTPGEKIVRVTAVRKTGRRIPSGEGSALVDEIVPYIPSRYNAESTLRVQVTASKVNTHDFHLTGAAPKR